MEDKIVKFKFIEIEENIEYGYINVLWKILWFLLSLIVFIDK